MTNIADFIPWGLAAIVFCGVLFAGLIFSDWLAEYRSRNKGPGYDDDGE